MKRSIYGVITAQVSDIEQKNILKGIIETAQSLNVDIVVISNIYNPNEPSDALKIENEIYNLILSSRFDGFILISESIINLDLQKIIINNLTKVSNIPVVVIGTPQPNFTLPHFYFINTNDELDFEDITDHLIDVHGFNDIHILSGFDFIETSHKRIEGYKKSIEKHGIEFDESKVFFGDFWINSGREQAKKYIDKELPTPQALICCNDYMAYGFLDVFLENNIKIPETLTVIGYEYVYERRNHNPVLTTYQRNRRTLGSNAVRLLKERLTTGVYGDFNAPKGSIIYGDTCTCGAKNNNIICEINEIKIKAMYDFLNLFNQLEQNLTKCRNIDEFVACCQEYNFIIRNVDGLYMCLYENWYNQDENSENMIKYNLMVYEKPLVFKKNQLFCLLYGDASPYYICPLFFANRELGFIVLRYKTPNTYDSVLRNWIKSISNNLEFLRMKNDIQYLLKCQNVAEYRDTLTGLLNEKGFKKVLDSIDKSKFFFVGLRVCLFEERLSEIDENIKVEAIMDIAECIHQFCKNNNMSARIDHNTFVCLVSNKNSIELLADCLTSFIFQHKKYVKYYGVGSFAYCIFECGEMSYLNIMNKCKIELKKSTDSIATKKSMKNYTMLVSLKTYIYLNPTETFNTDLIHKQFDYSIGHLRAIYKKCFGISFHQDCISSRIAKAKYLLLTTSMSICEIATRCGYEDNKYFIRQFIQETGISATQYRMLF